MRSMWGFDRRPVEAAGVTVVAPRPQQTVHTVGKVLSQTLHIVLPVGQVQDSRLLHWVESEALKQPVRLKCLKASRSL